MALPLYLTINHMIQAINTRHNLLSALTVSCLKWATWSLPQALFLQVVVTHDRTFHLDGLYGFGGLGVYMSVSVFRYATITASSSGLNPMFPMPFALVTLSGTSGGGQQSFFNASFSVVI
jgi:hypothetical protein